MPRVSIIIPCFNEEKTIRLVLEAIHAQAFPVEDLEVIIADGHSTDQTREVIRRYQKEHIDLLIRIVDNPQRIIPAGLNIAIRAAEGDVIIRMDAHSIPAQNYVQQSVADLDAGVGDNVGGVWDIRPSENTWQARSIAAAAAHKLGVGDAQYRYATQPAEVDTVPYGAFSRQLINKIGSYNEKLLANEDYEFNTRIRKNGGRVYLDPRIRAIYFARPTLAALAKQYWRYGFYKAIMAGDYPETLRWRQILPPLFVMGWVFGLIFSLALPWILWILLAVLLIYLAALLGGSISTARAKKDWQLLVGVPLAIITMHFCWGSGFLVSIIQTPFRRS